MNTTDYDNIVKEYVALADQRAGIDERMDTLKAELRKLGTGAHEIAGCKVTISPNRRIDTGRVTTLYPFTSHPELYKLTPDPKLLRENLPPKVVDTLMTDVGDPRVAVK